MDLLDQPLVLHKIGPIFRQQPNDKNDWRGNRKKGRVKPPKQASRKHTTDAKMIPFERMGKSRMIKE
jgi:hypothetical protein